MDAPPETLRAAAVALGGDPLALRLLAGWVRGCAESRLDPGVVSAADGADEEPVARVLALIERALDPPPTSWRERVRRWLGPPTPSPALAVLRVACLFDGPVDAGALAALRGGAPIAGLTDGLAGLSEAGWQAAVEALRGLGLVEGEGLHAPAPVRAWFGAALRAAHPAAWAEGHGRIARHYAAAAPAQPETLAAMRPLFRAVVHGCAAGWHQEMLEEIYWQRIQRADDFYAWRVLGAFAADEAAFAAFFAEPWDRPHPGLDAHAQAIVLGWASYRLRALGQVAAAVAPGAASVARHVEQGRWVSAAVAAGNLAETWLCLGCFGDDPAGEDDIFDADGIALGRVHGIEVGAIAMARVAVELADRSRDGFQRAGKRALLGEVLHQRGRIDEAVGVFEVAEGTQALDEPARPVLYGIAGYRYGELLRAIGQVDAARARAAQWRAWLAEGQGKALETALGEVLWGRLLVAAGDDEGFRAAGAHFEAAVAGLRAAGMRDELPRGLLARAAWYRAAGDARAARRDVEEAMAVAAGGGMRLYLADGWIEAAWQDLFGGDRAAAGRAYGEARALVEATGAGSRAVMLEALAAVLERGSSR
ncbi:MAG: hypothetical protein R3F65_19410 [bacterium]